MLREATYPPAAVNVLDVSSEIMAAFQVFMYGRFWVFTEDVTIQPIDIKKAFIRLAPEWIPKGRKKEWKIEPDFLDLRTLGFALFNESFSLKTLCKQLKTKHQKIDHEPTGDVTPKEIEYARQDGRCTVDALNALQTGV